MKTIKITRFLFLLFMCVCAIAPILFPIIGAVVAHAEEVKFDSSDVWEDLVSDPSFNVQSFPYKTNGEIELYKFVEYGYSPYSNMEQNFGLYIYIYNPSNKPLDEMSPLNYAQLATTYENGNPKDYEKYVLKFCGKTTGQYENRFFKFKIVDHKSVATGEYIIERVFGQEERRYDLAGIEICEEEIYSVEDHAISTTFYYSGYSAGYNPDGDGSTLKCRVDELETVSLNVNPTTWRSTSSNVGPGYQNQIDSVYFTVPAKFFDKYGKLQRIKAEWYEFQTKDIIVTSDRNCYNDTLPYVGKSDLNGFEWSFYNDYEVLSAGSGDFYASWAFNPARYVEFIDNVSDSIYYMFHTKDNGGNNFSEIKTYTKYSKLEDYGGISAEQLKQYMYQYAVAHPNEDFYRTAGGNVAKVLLEDHIGTFNGESREKILKDDNGKILGIVQYGAKGKSYWDFDVDTDLIDLAGYKASEHGFADNVKMFGFWKALFGSYPSTNDSVENLAPIEVLDNSISSLDSSAIVDRYFVGYDEADKISTEYARSVSRGDKVVLFRFATTDYFSKPLRIVDNKLFPWASDNSAYRAKESVFFNFDIIQLTFKDENENYAIIPAVSNPIDVVGGISPSTISPKAGCNDWWTTFLIVAIVLVLVILLFPVLPSILKGAWIVIKWTGKGIFYVLTLPYWIFKAIKKK